jgi:hypothetical protein
MDKRTRLSIGAIGVVAVIGLGCRGWCSRQR